MVKNLPAMQKTWVQSLSWENPLEKGIATHSSIFTWKSPWTEDPGGVIVHGVTKSWTRQSTAQNIRIGNYVQIDIYPIDSVSVEDPD